MSRVVWSEKALSDLDAALSYLERDSPAIARRFGESVLARVALLERFPLSGGVILEDQSRTYRELIQGPYRIIYRVEGERVLVVATHHSARLLELGGLV